MDSIPHHRPSRRGWPVPPLPTPSLQIHWLLRYSLSSYISIKNGKVSTEDWRHESHLSYLLPRSPCQTTSHSLQPSGSTAAGVWKGRFSQEEGTPGRGTHVTLCPFLPQFSTHLTQNRKREMARGPDTDNQLRRLEPCVSSGDQDLWAPEAPSLTVTRLRCSALKQNSSVLVR